MGLWHAPQLCVDTLKVENAYATSLECHMKEGPLFFLFQSTIKITVIMMLTNKSILLDLLFCFEFWLSSKLFGEGSGTPLQYSCLENPTDGGACWAAVHGVARSRTRLSSFTFRFHFHALEKEMATQSSVLAWRIPGTGEPGGLPSLGSHRVRHDWSNLVAAAAGKI